MIKQIKTLLAFFMATLVFVSCKKEDGNPLSDFNNLGTGVYLTVVDFGNSNYSYNDSSSTVNAQVDQYGGAIDKIELFVVEGASSDTAEWNFVKTVPFTGRGTEIDVTLVEMADALGVLVANLDPGTSYTFYTRCFTKDGRVFDLSNTPGAIATNPNYNSFFSWEVYITCPFTGNMAGNYVVIRDDWADWAPGDIVSVTDGPGPNQINLSQVYPNAGYPATIVEPLIVNIDPASGVATVAETDFGDYSGDVYTCVGSGADDFAGYVFSCTGYISLSLIMSQGGSEFGAFTLQLQRQ
jgi:hypothetical protein